MRPGGEVGNVEGSLLDGTHGFGEGTQPGFQRTGVLGTVLALLVSDARN